MDETIWTDDRTRTTGEQTDRARVGRTGSAAGGNLKRPPVFLPSTAVRQKQSQRIGAGSSIQALTDVGPVLVVFGDAIRLVQHSWSQKGTSWSRAGGSREALRLVQHRRSRGSNLEMFRLFSSC